MKSVKKWIVVLILIILLLLFLVLYLLFGREKSFTVTFNTDGGTTVSSIKVKDGEILELPKEPKKDGYIFVGWVDNKDNIITKGTKFKENITLKAKWIDNSVETVKVSFDTDGGSAIDDITMEKNKKILLPIDPQKDGYIFYGWLNEDGNLISNDMIINSDMKLKTYWIKKGAKTITIKVDIDGENGFRDITVEKGKKIVLPVIPKKDGFVFKGWVDDLGNTITKDTIVNDNMTIKVIWIEPYTCPLDCTPTGDGSKCTKELTTDMVFATDCPSGYTMSNGKCIGSRYYANNGNNGWECNNSSDRMYEEEDGVGGAFMWCEPTIDLISNKSCPNGYTLNGDTCKKIETLDCKAN